MPYVLLRCPLIRVPLSLPFMDPLPGADLRNMESVELLAPIFESKAYAEETRQHIPYCLPTFKRLF